MNSVIFKFDDYRGATRRVRKIDRFVRMFGIKITWGIVGTAAAEWKESEISWAKAAADSGLYCFWNHGWTHAHREFEGLGKEEAIAHLQNTQRVVREKLGIAIDTFGAPCNALNDHTRSAVEAVPELKHWFYGCDGFAGTNYRRELELEYPLFNPSFVPFVRSYRRLSVARGLYVLQGHPDYWGFVRRLNFYLIALYLKIRGVRFAFPGEAE